MPSEWVPNFEREVIDSSYDILIIHAPAHHCNAEFADSVVIVISTLQQSNVITLLWSMTVKCYNITHNHYNQMLQYNYNKTPWIWTKNKQAPFSMQVHVHTGISSTNLELNRYCPWPRRIWKLKDSLSDMITQCLWNEMLHVYLVTIL